MNRKTSAVIVAAGSGLRMMSEIPKQFITICGKPILAHTLLAFEKCGKINEIITVTQKKDIQTVKDLADKYNITKLAAVVAGGATRQESVYNGLKTISGGYVLIHDAARPLVTSDQISCVVSALDKYDAAAIGVPVADTLKSIDSDGCITGTTNREGLFSIQTPQGFKTEIIKRAHKLASDKGLTVTDDCAVCEAMGIPVKTIPGSASNIKITTTSDLELAEIILKNRGQNMTRVGFGYDVHKLTEGRELILGGVKIPYGFGLLGHSDADVLVHAIMDALLGSLALGDIGRHFPDTSEKWRGASSITLLTAVGDMLKMHEAKIVNIDSTIIAQLPKLSPYIPQMTSNISRALCVSDSSVSIKATTTEELGFCGRGEGIAAEAICSIKII